MDERTRLFIRESAREAAELNKKRPGDGYAYAVGTIRATLTDSMTPAEEKVAQAVLFLVDFDQEMKRHELLRIPPEN